MGDVSRRDLARLAGGGAALAATGLVADGGLAAPRDQGFPQDFVWGCATASYQIEGAYQADGRGLSNWDVFSHTPGKVARGDTGDVACDSYNRYREDTRLLKNLGVKAYRFSIAWSRIFPEGRGTPNQKGVDHYNRVIDDLLANGITPYVTLFHWDLPAALPGGWQNRDTAYAYADYAGFMAGKISDRVKDIMTINEFLCYTDLGHRTGTKAPGLKLPPAQVNQVRHHGVLAHGLGVQAVRAAAKPGTRVGLAENSSFHIPVIETPEHIAAAKKATRDANAPFLTAVMEGKYLDSYLEEAGRDAPKVQAGDMAAIGSPLDFVAINLYTAPYVRADDSKAGYAVIRLNPTGPRMSSPWLNVTPEAAYWGMRQTSELWNPKVMYVSENGCSAEDPIKDGMVYDADRVMYLRNYLGQFQRAVAEGYPLKGYFLWSLMDNFEWEDGYTKLFGIHHVDFKTQKRTPKLSAQWYKEVVRRNAVV
jgi:beta-glucosidase